MTEQELNVIKCIRSFEKEVIKALGNNQEVVASINCGVVPDGHDGKWERKRLDGSMRLIVQISPKE